MSVDDTPESWENPEEAIAALRRLDAASDDELTGVILELGRGDPNAIFPQSHLAAVAELFRYNRGAFQPNVGGAEDIAVMGGEVYVKIRGDWHYTGDKALEELLGDWCPQECEPVSALYQFTESVQPTLFGAFALMISADLANAMGRLRVELEPLGSEELRYLGLALGAVATHQELVTAYTRALLVLDGTLWKCRHRAMV